MTRLELPLLIPSDHPAFVGHFPGQPILPGVVLLDEVQHALTLREGLPEGFNGIRLAKFPSPVRPGEALRISYVQTGASLYHFEVLASDRVVASGVLTCNHPSGPGSDVP